MLKNVFLWLLILIPFAIEGQNAIDYSPRPLEKDIRKTCDVDDFVSEQILFTGLNLQKASQGKFIGIAENTSGPTILYAYVGRVNTCRAGGCNSPAIGNMCEDSEYFDYYIIFDTLARIQLVRIYNYQATHGYEVTSKGWLKQFEGYNGTMELEAGQNIDAISGATISVYGIVQNVKEVSKLLRQGLKLTEK